MIVVRVELVSAITGQTTELARMHIANDGTGSTTLSSYDGKTFVGRSEETLNRQQISKSARVENWPRQRFHVWNLVARMLGEMGYTK
jgi:hypothetical protein